MGQQSPPAAKKYFFPKMILDHMECQNKCFWRILSSWWPVVALLQSQNAMKMGCFGTRNGSKMGQKCIFPKMIPDQLGWQNKGNEPLLSPLQAILAPLKSQNALKMGCLGTKNGSRLGQKCVFPKKILDHLGCLNM